MTMEIGETVQLNAAICPTNTTNCNINWTTEDYDIASVNRGGGSYSTGCWQCPYMANATDDSGAADYCTITVNEPVKVESIIFSETEHVMEVGDEFTIIASVNQMTRMTRP